MYLSLYSYCLNIINYQKIIKITRITISKLINNKLDTLKHIIRPNLDHSLSIKGGKHDIFL